MTNIWQKLQQHHSKVSRRRIASLFDDKGRFADFSTESSDILLDYSKTNLDAEGRSLLIDLAVSSGLEEKIEAMFTGGRLNVTENRSVLHTALRSSETEPLEVDGADVRPDVAATLERLEKFSEAVRSGKIRASRGEVFKDVVNIGIGGSDLGPVMVTKALESYQDWLRVHFVSNVDAAHIGEVLRNLNPRTTLVVITSKTFTTIETMTNAQTALDWLEKGVGKANAMQHLAAVSSATDKTTEWGIDPARVFGFADWVGGRYSLWGPVGLSILLAIGTDHFRQLLAGAEVMDQHFRHTEFQHNIPVLLALVSIWHRNICDYPTRAILPYDQRLAHLPAYLQQLDMESNGKSINLDSNPVEQKTGAVVWGQSGTNGQHSFYQLLHQGTDIIPVDFLIAAEGPEPDLVNHHNLLIANCLAQSEAMMHGRSFEEGVQVAAELGLSGDAQIAHAAHRILKGNRPSVTLAYPNITPFSLGQIIAMYEHRTFVEGVIWRVNSFDQMGIELGKELANAILPLVAGADASDKDSSTQGLLRKLAHP